MEGLEEGRVRVRVPRGLAEDVRAFLTDRRKSAVLRDRLAAGLGADPSSLGFEVAAEGRSRRYTADEVRAQKLSEMMAVDPHLREAVEELDLKLKE